MSNWNGRGTRLISDDGVEDRTGLIGPADRRSPRDRGGVIHQPVVARDVPRRARERWRVVLLSGTPCRRAFDRLLLGVARARRVAHQQPGGIAGFPTVWRGDRAARTRARTGGGDGRSTRHPGSAALERLGAAAVRAVRVHAGRSAPRLLREAGGRRAGLVARKSRCGWTLTLNR